MQVKITANNVRAPKHPAAKNNKKNRNVLPQGKVVDLDENLARSLVAQERAELVDPATQAKRGPVTAEDAGLAPRGSGE